MCQARAVAAYAYGHRDPENDKMREGKRLHTVVQAYLRDGTVPAANDTVARKMVSVLPYAPGSISAHNVERALQLPDWFGYIDFEPNDHDIVSDLKFTSSLKYQLDVDPETDPQRIIYAMDAFHRDPERETINLVWWVATFDGQQARPISIRWTRHDAARLFKKVVEPHGAALAQHLANEGLHWQDVPKNMASCGKYPPSGCPVALRCERSIKKQLSALRPK